MASATFTWTSNNVYFFGNLVHIGNYSGEQMASLSGQNARTELLPAGTAFNMRLLVGQTYSVVVDGGASTPIVPSGTNDTWQNTVIFTGLSDTTHTVVFTGQYVNESQFCTVTGAAPALAQPTGYGTSYLPLFNVSNGAILANVVADGVYTKTSNEGYANVLQGTQLAVRWVGNHGDVWIWCNDAAQAKFVLLADGNEVGLYTPPVGIDRYNLAHVGANLSGTHTYELVQVGIGKAAYIHGLMFGGGTGVQASSLTTKPIWGLYGDSIAAMSTGPIGNQDFRIGDFWQLCRAAGAFPYQWGSPGQPISTYLRDNTANITALSPNPPVLVTLEGGTNDIAPEQPDGVRQ